MLVALVQGIVSAIDEDLGPLNEAGGGKASDHANKDFLRKCRVHGQLQGAEAVPLGGGAISPERRVASSPAGGQGEGLGQKATLRLGEFVIRRIHLVFRLDG